MSALCYADCSATLWLGLAHTKGYPNISQHRSWMNNKYTITNMSH